MVRRFSQLRWWLLLAGGLYATGCAQLAERQKDPARQPAPPPMIGAAVGRPDDRKPPELAPPLQIADQPVPSPNPVRLTGNIESPPLSLPETHPQTLMAMEAQPEPPEIPASFEMRARSAEPPAAPIPRPSQPLPPAAPAPAPAPERLFPVPEGQPLPARASETVMPLRELHRLAVRRYASVDGYVVRLRRREVVAGKRGPEEILLVRFRKEPWSVYLRWIGAEAKNREVVYVKDQHGNQIHTLTSATDTPLGSLGAGKHVQMPPDHPLVLSRSRYSITETGVGALLDRYARILERFERGDNRLGTLKYLGQVKRPEFDTPVEAVMHLIPPGAEPALPHGGQRFWFFDATNLRFPVLIVTQDDRGGEVEYYCYDNFLFPAHLRDDDFDPDRLWKR